MIFAKEKEADLVIIDDNNARKYLLSNAYEVWSELNGFKSKS